MGSMTKGRSEGSEGFVYVLEKAMGKAGLPVLLMPGETLHLLPPPPGTKIEPTKIPPKALTETQLEAMRQTYKYQGRAVFKDMEAGKSTRIEK